MKVKYGVRGMMEWVALIPTRRNIVRVRFEGGRGAGYGYGSTPATFLTDNPAVIRLIEGSSYFRQGKIFRVDEEEEAVETSEELARDNPSSDESSSPEMGGTVSVEIKKPGP